jgi:hypothetical protein
VSRNLVLVALCLVSASCAGWWWGGASLKQTSRDHVKIPHARHAKAEVECVVCHEQVYDSEQLGDVAPAREQTCLTCHKERAKDCSMCHTQVKARQAGTRSDQGLRMSHAKHIERTKEDCAACHKQLPEPVATDQTRPSMDACLACHEHRAQFDAGNCKVCHADLARYPLKPTSSFTHAGNFVREHMRPARAAPETCATCHDQTFCTDCHAKTVGLRVETKLPERVDRDFIHRNDFVTRHAIEGRADPVSCARCHGTSFCETCHTAQNLTPRGSNPRSPHPPGFAARGGAQFHGDAARVDINACAACHDQGPRSNCVACHKVGGIGGNPHPPSFGARHDRAEAMSAGNCTPCHSP